MAVVRQPDSSLIQSKVIELNDLILSAQSSAIDAKLQQTTLLEQISALEAKIASFEKWDAEKQRYKLTQAAPGIVAHVLKRSEAQGEPGHALCPNCYEKRTKSILQHNGEMILVKIAHVCPACRTILKTGGYQVPKFAEDNTGAA